LALHGSAFKRFANGFNAVLKLGAVRRKKPHDLVLSTDRPHRKPRRGKIDDLADLKLVARYRCLLMYSARAIVALLLLD
jgi:hypothetical protein